MADLPIAARGRVLAATLRASLAADTAARSAAGAAFAIVAVAAGLQLARIEPGYVAAAFVVVFARKLADKRLSSTVYRAEPTPASRRASPQDVLALDGLQ